MRKGGSKPGGEGVWFDWIRLGREGEDVRMLSGRGKIGSWRVIYNII